MYPSQLPSARFSTSRQTLLVPQDCSANPLGRRTAASANRHRELLDNLQRFRAQSYLQDGAIHPSEVTADGRHEQPADRESWHLLTHNDEGELVACARYHPLKNPSFPATTAARSPLAHSSLWRRKLQTAVEHSIEAAAARRASFAELGGWCVAPQARHTPVALHSVLYMFALGEVLGGTIGLSTATRRHASASILQRLGARQIALPCGEILPAYFDPRFNCDMELLVFDSLRPAPRYAAKIAALRDHIETQIPVLAPDSPSPTTSTLANLLHSLQSEGSSPFDWSPAGQGA
ncbi:MAG TPA: hypothetical protein VFQ91_08740 [Bryobacteraceae bacterium]|nr:hypothetical protein [Bryobacteraceae bacterium]